MGDNVNPLTLNVMMLFFLAAAVTTYWRLKYRHNGINMARFVIFAGGVVFYAWLQSPLYVPEMGRWWVRVLFVAWLLPEILENVEIIRGERKQEESG